MPDVPRLLAGRYRLDSVIGRGGMGLVWLGVDETLGREVAVKEVRLPPQLDDEEREALCERMLREARLTAQLSHPGVVTVYDVVSDDSRPFIVMELVRAPSLSDEVARAGPLPPAAAAPGCWDRARPAGRARRRAPRRHRAPGREAEQRTAVR